MSQGGNMNDERELQASPWIYSGGRAEILIVLPSGRRLRVKRGETIELMPNEAEAVSNLSAWNEVELRARNENLGGSDT
jgi:hypothetical protein